MKIQTQTNCLTKTNSSQASTRLNFASSYQVTAKGKELRIIENRFRSQIAGLTGFLSGSDTNLKISCSKDLDNSVLSLLREWVIKVREGGSSVIVRRNLEHSKTDIQLQGMDFKKAEEILIE